MGTYIAVGPCYEFDVDVRGLNEEKIEEVKKNSSAFIDIEAFNCSVNDGIMSFTAKEDIFIDGFAKLVERQYEIWKIGARNKKDVETVLSKLSEIKTVMELIDLAKGEGGLPFAARCYYQNVDFFAGIENLIKLDCPVPASRFIKVILTGWLRTKPCEGISLGKAESIRAMAQHLPVSQISEIIGMSEQDIAAILE